MSQPSVAELVCNAARQKVKVFPIGKCEVFKERLYVFYQVTLPPPLDRRWFDYDENRPFEAKVCVDQLLWPKLRQAMPNGRPIMPTLYDLAFEATDEIICPQSWTLTLEPVIQDSYFRVVLVPEKTTEHELFMHDDSLFLWSCFIHESHPDFATIKRAYDT